MKKIWKFILVSLLLTSSTDLFAQKPEWLKIIRPDGIRIGVDLANYTRPLLAGVYADGPYATTVSRLYANVVRHEVTADISFWDHAYILNFDYGTTDINRVTNQFFNGYSYKNKGSYWRVGADWNIARKSLKQDAIFFGLRYGSATYSDSLRFIASSKPWGYDGVAKPTDRYLGGTDWEAGSASWAEITAGMKVKVWSNLYLGYTFRYKFLLKVSEKKFLEANELPGYGTTESDSKPAFSYHLYWRIPFRNFNKVPDKENKQP